VGGLGRAWLLLCVTVFLGPRGLSAQENVNPVSADGGRLRVEVLTAEPGDLIWERFGHNALRIVDEASGLDVAWNWGVFDFRQEGFIPRLMRGTMLYQMAPYSVETFLQEYDSAGRAVWSQELDLTPSEKEMIQRAVLENYRPENRSYRYDYYRDNCSTRIRDILDRALGGRIRTEAGSDTTRTTFRWHTRRLLGEVFWAYTGIQLVLGHRADEPITAWEEMFIPMRLRDYLSQATVVRDGMEVPLVRETRLLLPSTRDTVPEAPRGRLPLFLVIGIAWAGAILLSAKGAEGGAWPPRAATALLSGGWSLLAGASGMVLVLAWAFTDHVFWAWNENLLQTDPLSLLVLPGMAMLLFRPALPSWASRLAGAVALLSLAGFAVQVLPWFDQVNAEVLAAAVPINFAVAVAARRLGGTRRNAGGARAGRTERTRAPAA
jgi:hypothetical protein